MRALARCLLDRNRLIRIATLDAYRSGCPPLLNATASQKRAFFAFQKVSRTNYARVVVRAPAERMAIRSIRTAAADDDNGDQVAWSYFTRNGLDVDSTDVHSDMLTFAEAYVRVSIGPDGKPIALRRDPRCIITAQDPLNPHITIAAFELVWDEWSGTDYAYLWLPGQQWVASRPRTARPQQFTVPGVSASDMRRFGYYFPRLSFDPSSFTMRPDIDTVDPDAENYDSGPYSQKYTTQRVPVVKFPNRDGVGEFEEHLDLLDRINHGTMTRVVAMAVQAYKQRALEQKDGDGVVDKLPEKNPETGQAINWDEIFEPGPDALWKLPPGVSIWESSEVLIQPMLSAELDDTKKLSATTSTPFSLFAPDGVNQSAEGAQLMREGLVFKVEDRDRIAGRKWAEVISLMFEFAPDEDRFDADGNDRADAGKIVIDWLPPERYSLQERASADSLNKSLSADMAAEKLWGLSPDEVAINKAQRAGDALLAPPVAAPAPKVIVDEPAA